MNLIAALCNADRRTGDLGQAFGALGYRLHELEACIYALGAEAHPDAVVSSAQERQTILVEATAKDQPDPRKIRQVAGYEAVTTDDIVAYGVAPTSARFVDAWWLVLPASADAFAAVAQGSLVTSFCHHSGELRYVAGGVGAPQTAHVLQRDWSVRYLPRSLVTVSTDSTSPGDLVNGLLQQLVSALEKGQTEVTAERLAQGLWPRAWRLLSNTKRAALTKSVDRAVGAIALSHRPALLHKDRGICGWRIAENQTAAAVSSRLRRDAPRIQARLRNEPGQLPLFDYDEIQ